MFRHDLQICIPQHLSTPPRIYDLQICIPQHLSTSADSLARARGGWRSARGCAGALGHVGDHWLPAVPPMAWPPMAWTALGSLCLRPMRAQQQSFSTSFGCHIMGHMLSSLRHDLFLQKSTTMCLSFIYGKFILVWRCFGSTVVLLTFLCCASHKCCLGSTRSEWHRMAGVCLASFGTSSLPRMRSELCRKRESESPLDTAKMMLLRKPKQLSHVLFMWSTT